jgi:hypothetical protein
MKERKKKISQIAAGIFAIITARLSAVCVLHIEMSASLVLEGPYGVACL